MNVQTVKLVVAGACILAATFARAIDAADVDAMVSPLQYITAHKLSLNERWWGGRLYHDGCANYSDYLAAAGRPGAKLAIVFKVHGNSYWHKLGFTAGGNDVLVEETGVDAATGEHVVYNSSGSLVTGNYFSLDDTFFILLDPPANPNFSMQGQWTDEVSTGWNVELLDIFVAVPTVGHIWQLVFSECPATLQLGESAPCRAVLVDKITGETNENSVVTYSTGWENCHYENGRLYARATADATEVTATAVYVVDEETGATATNVVRANVSVPSLRLERFVEVAHWDVDWTIRNWWTEIGEGQYGALFAEMAEAMNRDGIAIKIDYTHQAAGTSWNQMLVRINYDDLKTWHFGPVGTNYAEGTELEAVAFFRDGFNHINQFCFNTNDALIRRITVYRPFRGMIISLR